MSYFYPKRTSLARVSVIIVSYNAPCFLELCLDSVQASLKDLDGEIIVVDNASTEGCVEMVREKFPKVKLQANSENRGFSKGVNQGVRQASGEYILILNPDSVLPEDAIVKVLDFAVTQKDLGAVGCRFMDGRGEFLPECKRNFPGIRSASFKLLGLNRGYYADHLKEEESGEVEVLSGAFMLMRRNLFNQLNGFDEDYFMYGEDIDLSYRIRRAGFRNHYLGNLGIIHFKGESSLRESSHLQHFYGALEIYYRKHFRNSVLGRYLLGALVSTAIRLRSRKGSDRSRARAAPKEFICIGKRKVVYEDLKELMPEADPHFETRLESGKYRSGSLLFFDRGSLSFSEIISGIQATGRGVRKRIVSASGEFYAGSDDPREPGECRSLS